MSSLSTLKDLRSFLGVESSSQEFLVLAWLCHAAQGKPRAMQIGTHNHKFTELPSPLSLCLSNTPIHYPQLALISLPAREKNT